MNKLPLGQGHGSVFILAKNMTVNANSRIGATYNGNKLGGEAVTQGQHGYSSIRGQRNGAQPSSAAKPGDPAYSGGIGGYGSNSSKNAGKQGAHVFVISTVIDNFSLGFLSTGGGQATGVRAGNPGGAGYGASGVDGTNADADGPSGGTYNTGGSGCDSGDGGGSSGWAFFYVNQVNNININGIQI